MTLRMEPGQTYDSWVELKEALDAHCQENKVIFNIANAKTVESANSSMKKGQLYDLRLKYAHCILQCKHFGSYTSSSNGVRPKQRLVLIQMSFIVTIDFGNDGIILGVTHSHDIFYAFLFLSCL